MAKKQLVEAELKLDSKQYERALKQATKTTQNENKKQQKSYNDTSSSVKNNSNIIAQSNNNIATSSRNTANSINSSSRSIQSSHTAVASSANSMATAVNSSAGTIENANSAMAQSANAMANSMSNSAGATTSAMNGIGASASSMAGGVQGATQSASQNINDMASQAQEASKNIKESFEDAFSQLQGIGDKISKAVSLPITGGLTAGAKLAIDYETGLKKVSTLLDLSKVDLNDYSDEIKKMAKDGGIYLNDFTEATYQAISAGIDQGEAINFVHGANKLARGGFTDLTTAVDTLTTINNTYGKSAGTTIQQMDKLIQMQNKGKTTVGEMAGALADTIPTGNSLGVVFDELGGSIAFLTTKGMATSVAGTKMKAMLSDLGKYGSKAYEAIKNQTGKTADMLLKEGKDIVDILGIIEKEASKKGMKLADMFGSVEAGDAAKTIMGDLENYRNIIKQIGSSDGATESASGAMEDTKAEKFKKAIVNVQTALVNLGESLFPIIDAFAEMINVVAKAIDWYNELDGPLKVFINIIGIILAILPVAINLITTLGLAFFAVQTITLPVIGIIVAVIAVLSLLIGIVAWAILDFDGFCSTLQKVGEFLMNLPIIILGLMAQLIKLVLQLPLFLLQGIGQIFVLIMSVLYNLLANIGDTIQGILCFIVEAITMPFKTAFLIVAGSIQALIENFKLGIDFIVALFDGDLTKATDIAKEIGNNLWNTFKETFKNICDVVKNGIKNVLQFFDFEWKLPPLKMPHFSISGGFSLNPLSVPSFSVDWYSKGAIFTKPTVLANGMGVGDAHNGVGSAGEAILPIDKLPELLGLNKGSNGVSINIQEFNNHTSQDIDQLTKEIAFNLRRRGVIA